MHAISYCLYNSEKLSELLTKHNIKHEVLNAKNHAREADIIAEAGRPGAVTIATNMAGRGTDIVLGGNLKAELEKIENLSEEEEAKLTASWEERHRAVLEAGGLHMIGTERHEARRIDNQLRGRAGRQGDPGSSQFYLSLQDPLMRIFASDKVSLIMRKLGTEHGEAISHPMLTRTIESAQRRVEGRNFDIRKQMLEYDNVSNEQRVIIYKQRDELLNSDDVSENLKHMFEDVMSIISNNFVPENSFDDEWDLESLDEHLKEEYKLNLDTKTWLNAEKQRGPQELATYIMDAALSSYAEKIKQVDEKVMRHFEKSVMLHCLDKFWREHLATMDSLRQGIYLRGYAQKDPRQEFKREAFMLFTEMLEGIKSEVVKIVLSAELKNQQDLDEVEEARRREAEKTLNYQHDEASSLVSDNSEQESEAKSVTINRAEPKVGRNSICPCGSGKKYKQCHGKLT